MVSIPGTRPSPKHRETTRKRALMAMKQTRKLTYGLAVVGYAVRAAFAIQIF
jgi:hypothetical protein